MKITLNIPNIHAEFFMHLIKNLNFDIKIEDQEDIPDWHKPILEERLDKYKNGDKSQFKNWENIKKHIENEL